MTTNQQKVEKLLSLVAKRKVTIAGSVTSGKLYELQVLGQILKNHKKGVSHIPPSNGGKAGLLTTAGGPASMDKSKYSHFLLSGTTHEAWISVQMTTLSWSLVKPQPSSLPLSAFHEIDVAIFKSYPGPYPPYDMLILGASCKNVTNSAKVMIRETLGMKRETARLSPLQKAEYRWMGFIPSIPPSAIYLYSTDSTCTKYQQPVDKLGVYVRHLAYPPV